MYPLFNYILLNNHRITLKAATLTFAGDGADPFERHIFGIRELSRILDVIPHTIHHLPELPLDLFSVVHRVASTTVFDPPQLTAVLLHIEISIARHLGNIFQRILRSDVFDRLANILTVKINRMPKQFPVTLIRCEVFAKLIRALGPHTKCRARLKANDAITGGITEIWCAHYIASRILTTERGDT